MKSGSGARKQCLNSLTSGTMPIYTLLADDIASQIQSRVLRAGERLQARAPLAAPPTPVVAPEPTVVDVDNLLFRFLESVRSRPSVPLGSSFPSPVLFPLPKLGQQLGVSARRLDPWRTVEDLPPGNAELRRGIARRYLESGVQVEMDDIVITNGAAEALLLSLQVTTQPGDVVAVESPAFYGALHAIQMLGRRAVSIPTCSTNGMDLAALDQAIARQSVKAVWAMPNFHNPTGALMPLASKCRLVELLALHDIPLIEDDAYAELYFGSDRPQPAKAFDCKGLVLHCGSFSKCLAPGYRVGWVAPGRYSETIKRHKFLFSISTNVVAQAAIADFVKQGGYELHLRRLRAALLGQRDAMLRAITRHFPAQTCVSRPDGGYFVWVALPPGSPDAMSLLNSGERDGACIAPGPLFSPAGGFEMYLRLNFGHPWTAQLEQAIQALGRRVGDGQQPARAAARSARRQRLHGSAAV